MLSVSVAHGILMHAPSTPSWPAAPLTHPPCLPLTHSQVILASEASRTEAINHAMGEAEAIFRRSEATAKGLHVVADALGTGGGPNAAQLRVAEQYVEVSGGVQGGRLWDSNLT